MQNSYKRERKYSSYVSTVRALLLDDTEFVHYILVQTTTLQIKMINRTLQVTHVSNCSPRYTI